MEGPTSKKTKEPPIRANLKGNIKFWQPLVRSISNTRRQKNQPKRANLKGNIKFRKPLTRSISNKERGRSSSSKKCDFWSDEFWPFCEEYFGKRIFCHKFPVF